MRLISIFVAFIQRQRKEQQWCPICSPVAPRPQMRRRSSAICGHSAQPVEDFRACMAVRAGRSKYSSPVHPLGEVSKGEGPQSLPFVPRGGMGDGGVPQVSGGGLRGRYLCAKDTFPLPWHGNVPLWEQRDFSPRKKFFPHRYVRFRATFPRIAAIFERTASRKRLPRPPQSAVLSCLHYARKEYPMDFQEIFSLPGGGRP